LAIADGRAGSLLSVNVGLPQDLTWHGRTVHTAVWKRPAEGPRLVRRLNIDGDGQGDLAGHGGEHRAVFVYQIESYRYWREQLGRDDFSYGQFGENFTVGGLADDQGVHRRPVPDRRGGVRGNPAQGHLLPGGHPDGRPADARAARVPPPARVLLPGAAGEPADGPLVEFARSGLTVHWGPGQASLLELAEACDVPVRWSCRTGVCHTCETDLLSGTVSYAPDPVEEPADGSALICCSQPRGDLVLDL